MEQEVVMRKYKLPTRLLKGTVLILFFILQNNLYSQQTMATHTRGKLWETLFSYGIIGSNGAWDYQEVTGLGFYPGFSGYYFPSDELQANSPEKVTNANFHNFRSGPWIIAKNLQFLEAPDYSPKPKDFLMYHASLTPNNWGTLPTSNPFTYTKNYIGSPGFDPFLPEEMYTTEIPTLAGITIRQTSMAWSYPGYSDFIIYDYVIKNTGDMVITALNSTKHLEQTLNEVWFVFHSGISVSTKGILNFHYNPSKFEDSAAPAGGFGGYKGYAGSDIYSVENNDPGDGKGPLYYSRDFNGGREPVAWDQWAIKSNWQELLRLKPEWAPELQDPACFGYVMLYRTPPQGSTTVDPLDADPSFLSVYNNTGDNFKGKDLNFHESFGLEKFKEPFFYDFARHNYLRPNDNKMYAWYTSSFGPYKLAPGDSIRIIVAEVAGELDLKEIIKGDPDHQFPDSSIAAIRRNAEAARNAIKWGIGSGRSNVVADVPEPPPAPNCTAANASKGSDTAIIAVRWDKLTENSVITDGANSKFFDGSKDLTGYRIYRGTDERGIWDLVADIPKVDFDKYWNVETKLYEYFDKGLQFGFDFYYYVEAYNSTPNLWTSLNGTPVANLPELKSADYNKTPLTSAKPGPIDLNEKPFDVFVVPNPFIEGDYNYNFGDPNRRKIEFRNLPERATIKLFNVSGELVKTLSHGPDSQGNLAGSIAWDQTSDSGLLVAPGLYIFVVQSDTKGSEGKKDTGKFMIIR